MRGGVFMQKTMQMQKKKYKRSDQSTALIRHVLTAGVCCVVLMGGMLAAMAQLVCKMELPLHILMPLATAACCLAVLPSSMLLSFLEGKRGLLSGAIFGFGVYLLLWVISIAQGQAQLSTLAALKGLAMLTSGAVGGYLGVMVRAQRKKLR